MTARPPCGARSRPRAPAGAACCAARSRARPAPRARHARRLAAPASAAEEATAGGGSSVQHNRISIQLYTLRDAMTDPTGVNLVLQRLSQYGYERVELRRALRLHGRRDEGAPRPARHLGELEPRRHQRRRGGSAQPSSTTPTRSARSTSSCPYLNSNLAQRLGEVGRADEHRGDAAQAATGCATATTTTRTSSRSTSAAASRRGRSSPRTSTRGWCTSRSTSTGSTPVA